MSGFFCPDRKNPLGQLKKLPYPSQLKKPPLQYQIQNLTD